MARVKCKKCGAEKDTCDFYKRSSGKLRPKCKTCMKEENKVFKLSRHSPEGKLKRKLYSAAKYRQDKKLGKKRERTEQYKEWERKYFKDRYKTNPEFVVVNRYRSRISSIVRKKQMVKSRKSLDYLGCTSAEFLKHIESNFLKEMSWENRELWHIDHIKPCCSFDLTQESELKKCFNYLNLRPLWKKDNFQKGILDRKKTTNKNSKYYASEVC